MRKYLLPNFLVLILILFPGVTHAAADTWTETNNKIYATNTNANVGIGTTDPQASLSVQGKRAVIGSNEIIGNYNTNDAVIEINGKDGAAYINFISKLGGLVFGSSNYQGGQNGLFSWKVPFVLVQDGIERFRITPSGNIGIGTTAPNSLLHLKSAGTTLRLEDTAGAPKFSFMDETSTERAFIQLRDTGSDQDALIIRAGSDDIKFRTQNEDNDAQTTLFLGGSGNVGVGKIDPGQRLDVAGYVKGAGLCIGDDCRTAWPSEVNNGTVTGSGAGSYLSQWVSSTELGTSSIFDNGSIGIGTTAPSAKLDVNGTIVSTQLRINTGTTNDAIYIASSDAEDGDGSWYVGTNAGAVHGFGIYDIKNEKTRLSIDLNGNIGIAKENPQYTLDVDGDVKGNRLCISTDCRTSWPISGSSGGIDGGGTSNYLTKWTDSGSVGNSGIYETDGNVGIGTVAPTPHYDGAAQALIVAGEGGERAIIEAWGQNGGKALFQSVEGNTYIGNVEDGTNTAAGNTYIVRGDGTRGVTLSGATGNVGIGTGEPNQRLTVSGGGIRLDNNQAILWRDPSNTTDIGALLYDTNNNLRLRPGAADRVTIRGTDGYVGIGTTNPLYLLDVAGTVRSSELCLSTDCRKTWPTNPWETYENFIYSATNVGIKADPGNYALKVNGDAEFGKVFASAVNANTLQINNSGAAEFYDGASQLRGVISPNADGLEIYANTVTSLNSELYIRNNVGIGNVPEDSKALVVDGNSNIGIAVTSDSNIAIDATSGSTQAITAENNSSSLAAIEGYNPAGMGIAGLSQNGYGIYGWSQNSYAGYFAGPVRVAGDLTVDGDICLGQCN